MKEAKNTYSRIFLMPFIVLIILLIKSTTVLATLFSITPIIFISNLYAIMPLLFLISFYFLFPARRQLFYLIGLDLFISILFVTDMVYGRAFGHLISVYMIFAKDVTMDLNASIISLIKWSDSLMLIDLPFLLIFTLKIKNIGKIKNSGILFVIMAVLSICGVCYQFVKLEDDKIIGNSKMYPISMSPTGYHMFDIYSFFYEKTKNLESKDIVAIENWLNENSKYQEQNKDYANLKGLIKGKNIITIQFESLENILMAQSYFGQEITPNINKLLGSSIYFNNIYEQVRDGNSSDAELLSIASMYPISNGSAFLRFGKNNYTTLPKLLNDEGYTSIAIHGDDKEFWNRNNVFPTLGFKKYISEEEFDSKTSSGMGLSDESLFLQSISEIKKLKQPYNCFIITLTSHMPFEIDKENQYLDLPNNNVTSKYLQSIHYTDKVFGDFYNSLIANGLLDNTILIIYADHEGIHKYYNTTLPDNNHEIPFIVHIPGMKGFEVSKVGGQVDIMPTIAYLLGIDEKKYSSGIMGKNIFNVTAGAVILPNNKILGEADNEDHLIQSQKIADLIISSNYFKN